MEATKTDLAWAAGVIDADGCIHISRRPADYGEYYYYQVAVQVTATSYPAILSRLEELFGGCVSCTKRQSNYAWAISARVAGRFLRATLPYLVAKKDQAECCIELRDAIHRTSTSHRLSLTEEEKAYRAELYERCKALKRNKGFE